MSPWGKPNVDSPVEVTLSCHDQDSLDEGAVRWQRVFSNAHVLRYLIVIKQGYLWLILVIGD